MFGTPDLIQVLRSGIHTMSPAERNTMFFPPPMQALDETRPHEGWSKVKMPGNEKTVQTLVMYFNSPIKTHKNSYISNQL